MAELVDFQGDISREKVAGCMQGQLKLLIKDLPVNQEQWSQEDAKIYQYAAKTLIDYANSDKDGNTFFRDLGQDILDYKISQKEEKQERLPRPNELPLTQWQLKQFKGQAQNMG